MSDKEPIPTSEYCIHGKLYGDCNPCELAAELAYDEFCKSPMPTLLTEPYDNHKRLPSQQTQPQQP
jgi:hypothetical protein